MHPPGVSLAVAVADIATHSNPVWRARSDFIIQAPLIAEWAPKRWEQLFVRRVGRDMFEVCCIPFFLYDVALGDVVATRPEGDWSWVLDSVEEPSGRYVFRVWIGGGSDPPQDLLERLGGLGALTEWASAHLLAVDAADTATARAISDYLAEHERTGRLSYEAGNAGIGPE